LVDRWFWTNGEAWSPSMYEWWFRRTRAGRRLRAGEQSAVVGLLESGLQPEHTVLEVGSGTGHYTALLDDRGARVVARDASEAMVRYLRHRLDREERPAAHVDIGRLPHELNVQGPFDGALAIGVLNYVEDLSACLTTFADLLAPGGWLVFSVPPNDRGGRRYRLVERLGRRRIFLRSPEEVAAAADAAGLVLDGSPTVAGVMAVYRCVASPERAATAGRSLETPGSI
jgi:SAM-dependent methyltransferase